MKKKTQGAKAGSNKDPLKKKKITPICPYCISQGYKNGIRIPGCYKCQD